MRQVSEKITRKEMIDCGGHEVSCMEGVGGKIEARTAKG